MILAGQSYPIQVCLGMDNSHLLAGIFAHGGMCEYSTFANAVCEIIDNAIEATAHCSDRKISISLDLNEATPKHKVSAGVLL